MNFDGGSIWLHLLTPLGGEEPNLSGFGVIGMSVISSSDDSELSSHE
jgi:hypothetical protein